MAIQISIDHAKQLVISRADDTIRMPEVLNYLDALVVGNLMPYAKVFDAGDHETQLGDNDLMTMAARINAYATFDPRGPLALVARAPGTRDMLRRIMNVDRSKRPSMLFERTRDALGWLAEISPPPKRPGAAAA